MTRKCFDITWCAFCFGHLTSEPNCAALPQQARSQAQQTTQKMSQCALHELRLIHLLWLCWIKLSSRKHELCLIHSVTTAHRASQASAAVFFADWGQFLAALSPLVSWAALTQTFMTLTFFFSLFPKIFSQICFSTLRLSTQSNIIRVSVPSHHARYILKDYILILESLDFLIYI